MRFSSLPNGTMPAILGSGGRARWRRPLLLGAGALSLVYFLVLATSDGLPGAGDARASVEERLLRVSRELQQIRDQSDQIMGIARQIREMRDVRADPDLGSRLSLARLESRLSRAAAQIDLLRAGNGGSMPADSAEGPAPARSARHEYLRRRAEMRARELGFLLDAHVAALQRSAAAGEGLGADLERFRRRAEEQRFLLEADLARLSRVDGSEAWRRRQLARLGREVQARIHRLQHPPRCRDAPKLVCNLNKGCGFGCQAHHVLYCLILAYASGRTFVLESAGWRYNSRGWTAVFLPLSDNCTTRASSNPRVVPWGAHGFQSAGVVEVPIVDALRGRPDYLPQAIPQDLERALRHLHGAPFVWFAGQLLSYVMRPNAEMQRQIRLALRQFDFRPPIVGVHIRRTDKVGTEAAFHSVEEYMKEVESWFRRYALLHGPPSPSGWRKRLFLATDDFRVLQEIRSKYPDYQVLSDNEISKTAVLSSRYTDRALRGVILDMVLLANTSYLVCTFSSQVCRVAYELMQPLHVDASAAFRSLDDIYYFGGQNAYHMRALMDHEPLLRGEIELRRGDLIRIAGNHWNGLSKGTNTRTGRVGLFPTYKAEFVVSSARMGRYETVRLAS